MNASPRFSSGSPHECLAHGHIYCIRSGQCLKYFQTLKIALSLYKTMCEYFNLVTEKQQCLNKCKSFSQTHQRLKCWESAKLQYDDSGMTHDCEMGTCV